MPAKDPEQRKLLWTAYHAKNREQLIEAKRRYRKTEKYKKTALAYGRKYRARNREYLNLYMQARRYGLSVADLKALIDGQNGKCAICQETKRLHVDHCHSTGRVRALLCDSCNRGLGMFKERPELLEAARLYLREKADAL